jgi:hypothetical protein
MAGEMSSVFSACCKCRHHVDAMPSGRRHSNSHILFSLYLGLFMWGGLWLRDPKLRAIFPIRRSKPATIERPHVARGEDDIADTKSKTNGE